MLTQEQMNIIIRDAELENFNNINKEDLKKVDEQGRTPLDFAIASKKPQAIRNLIKAGASIKTKNAQGKNPLHLAAESTCFLSFHEIFQKADRDLKDGIDNEGNTPLMSALLSQELRSSPMLAPIFSLLLKETSSFQTTNITGLTYLSLIIKYGLIKIMPVLIDQMAEIKASFDVVDQQGNPPLLQALSLYNSELYKKNPGLLAEVISILLKSNKFDPNIPNKKNKQTALQFAIAHGLHEVIPLLLENKADVDIPDEQGNPPLLQVISCAHLSPYKDDSKLLHKVLNSLLQNPKININVQNQRTGQTALYIAISRGLKEVISLLLERKANLDIVDTNGNTVLLHLLSCRNQEPYRNNSELFNAVFNQLIQSSYCNFDPNQQNSLGQTALHIAASQGLVDLIPELLKRNAKTDTLDANANTPLFQLLSCRNQIPYSDNPELFTRVFNLLLGSSHFDPNMQNSLGQTAVHIAASQGMIELLKNLLIERKAKADIPDDRGNTPLMQAFSCLDAEPYKSKPELFAEVATLFMEAPGFNPNVQNDELQTVFHLATRRGLIEIIKKLVDNKANGDLVDGRGNTPLLQAISSHDLEPYRSNSALLTDVVKILLPSSKPFTILNGNSLNALELALLQGLGDIISLLIERKDLADNVHPADGHTTLMRALSSHSRFVVLPFDFKVRVFKAFANIPQFNFNYENKGKGTLVHSALRNGLIDELSFLVKEHKVRLDLPLDPLTFLCSVRTENPYKNNTKLFESMFEFLVEQGCKLDAVDTGTGETPLHSIMNPCNPRLARLLISKKVPLNVEDKQGITPLMKIVFYTKIYTNAQFLARQQEIVELLIEAGADLNHKNSKTGWTALHYIANVASPHLMLLLLTRNATLQPDNDGMTPFLLVIHAHDSKQENEERLRRLLCLSILEKAGANVKETNSLGNNALVFAADHQFLEAIIPLRKMGVDPTARNPHNQSAIFFAKTHRETLALLTFPFVSDLDPQPVKDAATICEFKYLSDTTDLSMMDPQKLLAVIDQTVQTHGQTFLTFKDGKSQGEQDCLSLLPSSYEKLDASVKAHFGDAVAGAADTEAAREAYKQAFQSVLPHVYRGLIATLLVPRPRKIVELSAAPVTIFTSSPTIKRAFVNFDLSIVRALTFDFTAPGRKDTLEKLDFQLPANLCELVLQFAVSNEDNDDVLLRDASLNSAVGGAVSGAPLNLRSDVGAGDVKSTVEEDTITRPKPTVLVRKQTKVGMVEGNVEANNALLLERMNAVVCHLNAGKRRIPKDFQLDNTFCGILLSRYETTIKAGAFKGKLDKQEESAKVRINCSESLNASLLTH